LKNATLSAGNVILVPSVVNKSNGDIFVCVFIGIIVCAPLIVLILSISLPAYVILLLCKVFVKELLDIVEFVWFILLDIPPKMILY
jgi:hypothetical protein